MVNQRRATGAWVLLSFFSAESAPGGYLKEACCAPLLLLFLVRRTRYIRPLTLLPRTLHLSDLRHIPQSSSVHFKNTNPFIMGKSKTNKKVKAEVCSAPSHNPIS